jgi:hypothetical protein
MQEEKFELRDPIFMRLSSQKYLEKRMDKAVRPVPHSIENTEKRITVSGFLRGSGVDFYQPVCPANPAAGVRNRDGLA